MKVASIVSILLGTALLVRLGGADTYIAGPVSGNWSLLGSPYQVLADIEVPGGQTLTIDPGVSVIFNGNYKFIVHGTLSAVGSEGDSILLTHHIPHASFTWKGIYFEVAQGVSELAYCIIEWGYAQGIVGQPDAKGGAAHVYNSTVNIHHCRISDNKADVKGAGICLNGASGAIYANTIINNTSMGDGGGVFAEFCSDTYLQGNWISGNSAEKGAGVQFVYNGGALEENVITYNTATFSNGGGIYLEHSSPAIVGNVINHNSSTGTNSGSGIYCYSTSNPMILYNEICANNHSGVYCATTSGPQLENNTIYGNLDYAIWTMQTSDPRGASNIIVGNGGSFYIPQGCSVLMSYSNIQGGYTGTGNINQQPLFVDPYGDDFHLQSSSPCIDTGSPIAPLDPDGTRADMGAHFYDQTIGIEVAEKGMPEAFEVIPWHPNPFNAQSELNYTLPAAAQVNLSIFDLTGAVISTLVDGRQEAGRYRMEFNGSGLATGVYFYRMQIGDEINSGKLLLLK